MVSPQVNYVLFTIEPVKMIITTCPITVDGITNTGGTSITAYIRVYDGCPALTGSDLLAYNDPDYYCAYVEYDIRSGKRHDGILEGREEEACVRLTEFRSFL